MSRISVVVPVYNVEKFLDWSLSSLERQSMGDFEALCINDGSTDGSGEILAQWAKKDPRFKVITQENAGLSAARNAGIEAATSDYLCFMDSDDRFHDDALKTIVDTMDATQAEVLTFGADCYPAHESTPWLDWVLSPRDSTYEPFNPALLFNECSRPFSWRTACRRDFLLSQSIRFEKGFGEDQVFAFAIYPRSKKTVLISDKLYDYRVVRKGSLMDNWRVDLAGKLEQHVHIVALILKDWERGGFLSLCPEQLIDFILEFTMNDALKLDQGSYVRIATELRNVLEVYWSATDIERMNLPTHVKRLALQGVYRQFGVLARKKMAWDRYVAIHGRRAALKRVLGFVHR